MAKRGAFGLGYAIAHLIFFLFVGAPLAGAGQQFGLFAGLFYLFYALAIAIAGLAHELGHALTAQWLKWDVHLIALGPLGYEPKVRRLSWRWRRVRVDILGSVETTPNGGWAPLRHHALVAFGGPAANLLSAAVLFPMASLSPDGLLGNLAGALGIVSVGLALANLVPFRTPKGLKSDGTTIFEFLRQQSARLFSRT